MEFLLVLIKKNFSRSAVETELSKPISASMHRFGKIAWKFSVSVMVVIICHGFMDVNGIERSVQTAEFLNTFHSVTASASFKSAGEKCSVSICKLSFSNSSSKS